MGLRRLIEAAATGSAIVLAALAAPVAAQDGPPPPPPMYGADGGHGSHGAPGGGYTPPAEQRASWLAECRDRLADSDLRRHAAQRCEEYFDGYYAHYRMAQPGLTWGYPVATHGGGGCCQQPMTMMPVPRAPHREPECTETVEYEYVDVPVRAYPAPRAVPRKRVKVVPDKRIYIK
jgi:hypothetical protein